MEEKHVVTEDFYDSVMDRESKNNNNDWKWGSVFRMVHRQRLMNQKLG